MINKEMKMFPSLKLMKFRSKNLKNKMLRYEKVKANLLDINLMCLLVLQIILKMFSKKNQMIPIIKLLIRKGPKKVKLLGLQTKLKMKSLSIILFLNLRIQTYFQMIIRDITNKGKKIFPSLKLIKFCPKNLKNKMLSYEKVKANLHDINLICLLILQITLKMISEKIPTVKPILLICKGPKKVKLLSLQTKLNMKSLSIIWFLNL